MNVVFINCSRFPFIDWIMNHSKLYETRSSNTLRLLVGQRVLLAETGKGRSMVRCSAVIRSAYKVENELAWNIFRKYTRIREGSQYDWTPTTRSKWIYELMDVQPVDVPFHPPEGVRHGRVWMELPKNKVWRL